MHCKVCFYQVVTLVFVCLTLIAQHIYIICIVCVGRSRYHKHCTVRLSLAQFNVYGQLSIPLQLVSWCQSGVYGFGYVLLSLSYIFLSFHNYLCSLMTRCVIYFLPTTTSSLLKVFIISTQLSYIIHVLYICILKLFTLAEDAVRMQSWLRVQ